MNDNKDAEKKALEQLDETLSNNTTDDVAKQVEKLGEVEEAQFIETTTLGKIDRHDYADADVKETERKFGFHELYTTNFPSKGRYYAENIKIIIKAATVNEIRHFSTIDEADPYSVDEAIIDLLKVCTRVTYPDRQGSWKDIKEEDKSYIILSIRELTFAEDENRIAFNVKCSSCGADNEMEIKNDNFQSRDIPEVLQKYYNDKILGFDINTKNSGTIRLQPPSIGVMRIVADYIKGLNQGGVNLKDYMAFLKVLPYMVTEWRGFTVKDISNLRVEFLSWNTKKFNNFTKLTEMLQVGVKEKMSTHCTSCETIIEAEIELPTGVKGLFIEDDIEDELI